MYGLVFLEMPLSFYGLLLIEEDLTGDLYLTILEKITDTLITVELETQIVADGNLVLQEDLLQFKQDGDLPHYFLIQHCRVHVFPVIKSLEQCHRIFSFLIFLFIST